MKNLFSLLCCLIISTSLHAQWTNGQAASGVIGQSDFVTNTSGLSATRLNNPNIAIVDPVSGKVFVSESGNNRILRFASISAATSNTAAEAVFGQANFITSTSGTALNNLNTPNSLALDAAGNLWVADMLNHRVLRFPAASTSGSGASADLFLGTGVAGTTSTQFNQPNCVTIANNTLWVTERNNNRILRFDNINTITNNAAANAVLGQPNFTSGASGSALNQFSVPNQTYMDANGTLWVADYVNARILKFTNAALKANGAAADGFLGITSINSPTQNTFRPTGVTGDQGKRIYVSDFDNHRVLVFNNAANLPNSANANYVIGQNNFTSGVAGIAQHRLATPLKISISNNQLLVAEGTNHRITVFSANSPLPVQLKNFSAHYKNQKGIAIQWAAENESDLSYYQVEHRDNKSAEFNTIFTQEVRGSHHTYQTFHIPVNKGNQYYRIKMVGNSEEPFYSNTILVSTPENGVSAQIDAAGNQLIINTTTNHNSVLHLFSMNGALLKSTPIINNTQTIDISSLPSGVYVFHIIANGQIVYKDKLQKN